MNDKKARAREAAAPSLAIPPALFGLCPKLVFPVPADRRLHQSNEQGKGASE
jgi:hypothetical protein